MFFVWIRRRDSEGFSASKKFSEENDGFYKKFSNRKVRVLQVVGTRDFSAEEMVIPLPNYARTLITVWSLPKPGQAMSVKQIARKLNYNVILMKMIPFETQHF